LRAEIFWHRDRLQALELTAEEFLAQPERHAQELDRLCETFPLLLHGIELSLGSDEELDTEYLDGFAALAQRIRAPWVSEHLAFVRSGKYEIGHLTPLPPTREAAQVVARNVRQLQSVLDVPILLENITSLVDLPGEMTEWAFLRAILEATGAGLLLDVTNLYTNAINRGVDPWQELAQVPMEYAVELHLAGGIYAQDYLVDSHSAPIAEPVWELTAHILRHADIKAVLIERDMNFPPFGELLAEVERARALWQAARKSA
jgi:uncharacterized protein (UPF0276 family)